MTTAAIEAMADQQEVQPMRHSATQWRLVGLLTALLGMALLALVLTSWKTLLIVWHRERQAAYVAQWRQELQGTPEMQEVSRQKRRHRDELVRLGALVRRDYILEHRQAPADYRRTLLEMIKRQRAGGLAGEWSSPVAYTPTKMRVTVWCPPGSASQWDGFIQRLDVDQEESPGAANPTNP